MGQNNSQYQLRLKTRGGLDPPQLMLSFEGQTIHVQFPEPVVHREAISCLEVLNEDRHHIWQRHFLHRLDADKLCPAGPGTRIASTGLDSGKLCPVGPGGNRISSGLAVDEPPLHFLHRLEADKLCPVGKS